MAAAGAALLLCCLRGSTGRPTGEPCDGPDQCVEGLVCSYGRCRPACTFDRDCPEGGACVASEETGPRVCTFADEGAAGSAPCPSGLSQDRDGVCRERCDEPDDCGEGRLCVEGLCHDAAAADGDADVDLDTDADTEPDADAQADGDADDRDAPPPLSDFGARCATGEDCESGECFSAELDYPHLCYGSGCTAYCAEDRDCVVLATEAGVPRPTGAFCSSHGYCDLLNTGLPQFACE